MFDFTQAQFEEWLDAQPDESIIGSWGFGYYLNPLELFLHDLFTPEHFSVGIEHYCHLALPIIYEPCQEWMQEVNTRFHNACTAWRDPHMVVTKEAFLKVWNQ